MKKNENVKKSIAISALATGTVVFGSLAGSADMKAADLFSFETLGSGAQLRSELLATNDAMEFIKNNELELKCGEGTGEKKDGAAKTDKAATGKSAEGKAKAADAKTAKDGKAGEHKCGEGKAGEHKCGEGKCGEGKSEEKKASDDSDE